MRRSRSLAIALIAGLLTGPLACDAGPGKQTQATTPGSSEQDEEGSSPRETGLHALRERGELRILQLDRGESYLPRSGSPQDTERELAERLAQELGVQPTFIGVERFEDLLPALAAGRGDLAAENITVTAERAQHFDFSAPLAYVREQVITRADDLSVNGLSDLEGRRLAARPSTSHWQTALALKKRVPGMEIESVAEDLDIDALLDAVVRQRLDLTILDSNLVEEALSWRDDIRVAFDVPDTRVIAWALPQEADALRQSVDRFLARSLKGDGVAEVHRGGLPQIRDRGVIRVLTRNSGTTYFIWRGQLLGFEYELANRFAEELGVRLEMVVPPSRGDLIPWLLEGRGDLIAAGLTASPERAKREGIAFSRFYNLTRETVVSRADETGLESLEDLAGRRFAVRRSSSYWNRLLSLRSAGIPIEMEAVPEEIETEQIIAGVASGHYDLTLADRHILSVELAGRDDVRAAFDLEDEVRHGWAVRPEDGELLTAIDAFLDSEYRGVFYNITRKKYFQSPDKAREFIELRADRDGAISPWDDLARKHAHRYGFDWRLVVAQMYQESRFDPAVRSFAGARGLLQVMPRTAKELGVSNIEDPDEGIEAGVRYLSQMRDRLDSELSDADRTWFGLAAYNVGMGHLRDARRLARQEGLDPDRWFDNVERAMLLKEKPEYYRKTRFGFARGREPVAYVRKIRDRYEAYLGATARPASLAVSQELGED